MNKPPMAQAANAQNAWQSLRIIIDTILGRRGNRIAKSTEILREVSNPPTQAEVKALASDLVAMQRKMNELLEMLHGPYS